MVRSVGRLALVVALVVVATRTDAAPIVNSFGLASPTSTLTFGEIVFPEDTVITNQYAAFGVTFNPSVVYDPQGQEFFPGINGHNVGNFVPIRNPFSIRFGTALTAAAFGFASEPGTTTFEALLGGSVVESFSQTTTFDNPATAFIGFSGIVFDEIRITVGGDELALVDNIQQGTAAVPEPGTLALLGGGLVTLLARKRRSQAARRS